MVIILSLYIAAMWAVFSRFKLVRWGWLSGTISILVGAFILATGAMPTHGPSPTQLNIRRMLSNAR